MAVSEIEKELAPNTPEEEIREGEGEPNKSAKKKTAKKVKGKKDTEIEKGPVGSEGVTKANRPKGMPSLDKEEEVEDGCGCDHKKKKAKKDAAPLTAGQVKKDACWKGYVQQGMKMKGGKRVPNCVPAGAKKKKDAAKADGGSCGKKGKKSVWADGYELDAATLSIESRSLATDTNKSASRKPNAFSSVHNKLIAGTYNT